jgi:DNA-binding SARP family transcriptional activator
MAENWARELDPKERRRLLVEAIDLDLEAIGGREGVIRGGRRRGSCATGLESALDDELARIIAYAGALDRDHDASYPLAALELGRRSLVGQGPRAAEHWARRAARRVARVRSKGQRRWLRGQIDLLLGNALYQKGRLPAAEARFRRFLRTPEARDPQRGIGAFTALGQLLIKSAQPDEARRVLEEGRAALMDAPAEPGVLMASAEILCYLARIEMSRDELDLAAGLLEQASATLGDLHADPQVAEVAEAKERILVERALLSMRRGDLRKGIQGFEELLALGRHRPRDNASRLANLALYLALVGDLRRARPLALEALRAGRRMQDAYAASFRWVCLGLIEAIAGNWQLAVGAHRRARQLSEHGRDPGTWHLSTGELARAAQVLEGSEASDRLWHEAMRGSSVAGRPSRGHLFHLYWSRAWALLRRRDWKGALAASAQAAALVGANPRNHAVVELTALEAEVRLELEAAHEAGGTGRTRAENLARLASRLDSVEPYLREQLVRQELVNLARLRLYLILAGWRGARPEALIAEVESQLLEMNAPALMAEVAEEFSGTAVAALPRFQHAFEREQCKQPAAEAAAVELLSPDEPQHLLRVLALGRLKVFRCGESEPLTRSDWGSKKARILLAYLLAEDLEGRGVARDALLEAAWADDDSLTIEHTFGVTMTLLRKALGSARSGAGARLLLFADGVYRLDFSAVWCDCRAFEQALREAATCERNREPEQALEFRRQAFDLYQGEFLADFDEVWIDPRRERYRRRFLEIGGQLTEEALRVGDLGEAQEVAERLVSCDPLSEAAHHLLVRAYAAAGRHDAATRQRERCRALQKQFGAGDGRDLE